MLQAELAMYAGSHIVLAPNRPTIGARASSALSIVASSPVSRGVALSTLASSGTATVLDRPESADRLAISQHVLDRSAALTAFSPVAVTPSDLTEPDRRKVLALFATGWIGAPAAFSGAVAAYDSAIDQALNSVHVASSSTINVLASEASLPFTVENALSVPVQVRVSVSPSNGRIVVGESVEAEIAPNSRQTVRVPVKARIGNGMVLLNVTLHDRNGTQIGAATVIPRTSKRTGKDGVRPRSQSSPGSYSRLASGAKFARFAARLSWQRSPPMSNRDIQRASVLLASGTIVSRILGFVRAIVLAAAIGLVGSAGANMFGIANQLPNTIYAIVAGGVLSAIFVPQIVRASVAADGGAGYINKLLTVCIVLLGLTTVLATAAAPLLTTLYGTRLDAASLELAIAFAYWCLPQIFFYGLYTVFGEVLNARKLFGPYTWAPVLNNLVGLLGLVAFMLVYGANPSGSWTPAEWTPGMIALLAGSATLGVIAQALILLAFFRRANLQFRFDWKWRGFGLGTAGKLAGWTFGMLLLTTVAGIVETNVAGIASNTNQASVAALNNAWLIFMLPHSVIAVSIATAYFTRMSEHASRGDLASVRDDLAGAARGIGMLITLSTLIIIICSPFIGAVFMPGNDQGIVAFGAIVVAYVIGLLPFSLLFLVQRTFYTLGDTRTPFMYTLLQVVLICLGALVIARLDPSFIAIGIAPAGDRCRHCAAAGGRRCAAPAHWRTRRPSGVRELCSIRHCRSPSRPRRFGRERGHWSGESGRQYWRAIARRCHRLHGRDRFGDGCGLFRCAVGSAGS